jgi:hypothetical protein
MIVGAPPLTAFRLLRPIPYHAHRSRTLSRLRPIQYCLLHECKPQDTREFTILTIPERRFLGRQSDSRLFFRHEAITADSSLPLIINSEATVRQRQRAHGMALSDL